ncbi:MAG: hypothetical protein AAF391_11625 [Bacteroidota bacterium]
MKQIFVACALALAIGSFGQTKINFKSGINVSSLTSDLISEYEFDTFREAYIALGGSATSEVKNSVRVGFYLSAEADFYLNETLFIRSGLKFFNTGDSYFFKTNDVVLVSSSGSESDERFKFRQRLGYFSIPVNIGKQVSDRVTLYGGFTPSINVSNVMRASFFEADGDDVKEEWSKSDNPAEPRSMIILVNGGLNYLFPGGSVEYFIDFGFDYSLSSVYNDPTLTADFENANALNINIGFGMRL